MRLGQHHWNVLEVTLFGARDSENPHREVRNVKALLISMTLLGCLGPVGAALAEDDDGLFRSGPYFSVGPTFTTGKVDGMVEDIFEDAFAVPIDVDLDDSWGVNARLGYRFAPFFAAEVQYEWVDDFDYDLSSLGVDFGGATVGGHTATVNFKVIAPIWRVQPYALVGAGVAFYDFQDRTPLNLLGGSGSHEAFAGRAGLGIDFHLTDHLVLSTEGSVVGTTRDFEQPDLGDLDDYYYIAVTAGFQYRF